MAAQPVIPMFMMARYKKELRCAGVGYCTLVLSRLPWILPRRLWAAVLPFPSDFQLPISVRFRRSPVRISAFHGLSFYAGTGAVG